MKPLLVNAARVVAAAAIVYALLGVAGWLLLTRH